MLDLDISYSGSLEHTSFTDRLNYLSLYNKKYVSPRQFSHNFYKEKPWLELRDYVIIFLCPISFYYHRSSTRKVIACILQVKKLRLRKD